MGTHSIQPLGQATLAALSRQEGLIYLFVLVTALVMALGANFWFKRSLYQQERSVIDEMAHQIAKIAALHPYLEDQSYCCQWPTLDRTTFAAIRYESYCLMIFNLLKFAWMHHKHKKKAVTESIHIAHYVQHHWLWWDQSGAFTADLRFQNFIETYAPQKS